MKVLYVTGACLSKNTSANMSHNAFLLGLIESNCEIDVIMANDSWGKEDTELRDTVEKALDDLVADGTYAKIGEKYPEIKDYLCLGK